MRRTVPLAAAALFIAAATASAAPSASSAPDALWAKAVSAAAARADWVPGTATFLLELVDAKGAAQETWTSVYRLSPGKDGSPVLEVVRSSHNGADTTAKDKASQQKNDNRRPPPLKWDEPFDPAVQSTLQLARQPGSEAVDGRACAVYEFSFLKEDKTTVKGTAWIDAASGAPVQVRSSPVPLPRGVFEITTVLRYTRGPTGDGYLRDVQLEGVGGILFIRKSFRSTVAVADWWKNAGG